MPGILGPKRERALPTYPQLSHPQLHVGFRFHPGELEERLAAAIGIEGQGPQFGIIPWSTTLHRFLGGTIAKLVSDGTISEVRLPISGLVNRADADLTGPLYVRVTAEGDDLQIGLVAPTAEPDFAGATQTIQYESERHSADALATQLLGLPSGDAALLALAGHAWPRDLANEAITALRTIHASAQLAAGAAWLPDLGEATWRVSFLVDLPKTLSGSDEDLRTWIVDQAIREAHEPAGLVATHANAPEHPLDRLLASIDIEVTADNASEAIAFAKEDLLDPAMQWNVRLHDRMLLLPCSCSAAGHAL